MGFRAADAASEHAYPVRDNTKKTSHIVSGTLFTSYYGIPTEVAKRWPAQFADEILRIDLKQPGTKIIPRRDSMPTSN